MEHPGISRLTHYLEKQFQRSGLRKEVEKYIAGCEICARMKPKFVKVPQGNVILSTKPWQRIAIDFMRPKQSTTRNVYILTVVDEYSRYPFAFPLPSMTTRNVINCLTSLFTIFGPPSFIHSDRGAQFESSEFADFLHQWNIVHTRSTPYHSQGNGQIERISSAINIGREGRLCGSSDYTVCVSPWLATGQEVLLKKQHTQGKMEKVIVQKVVSPQVIQVKFSTGRTDTVSVFRLS